MSLSVTVAQLPSATILSARLATTVCRIQASIKKFTYSCHILRLIIVKISYSVRSVFIAIQKSRRVIILPDVIRIKGYNRETVSMLSHLEISVP